MTENYPRIRWLIKKAKTGPTGNEPSLIHGALSVFLYWRLWAGMLILLFVWLLLIYYAGATDDTAFGFIVGIYTAVIASEVMEND